MPVFLSIALHQELVSQCLMVRDASVIRQNPEAAIASDGEEHVLMPQNPWKCGHQLEESGNRFRTKNIICPEWKKQYWEAEKCHAQAMQFSVLKPTNGNRWLAYSEDKGISLVLRNRPDFNCDFFSHIPAGKALNASNLRCQGARSGNVTDPMQEISTIA